MSTEKHKKLWSVLLSDFHPYTSFGETEVRASVCTQYLAMPMDSSLLFYILQLSFANKIRPRE